MGALTYSKGNYHSLMVQGSKNARSKEKQIVKEKKPKSEIEDESLNPTDEDSVKKGKNKGRNSKCYYWNKGFHLENKCFKDSMCIMSDLLDKHIIEVPDELEKSVGSSEHCHSAHFQGDIDYALSTRVK